MKLERFFEKFEQFADAPNAVAKMRELVRHLAVRGRLVAQYPRDESAGLLVANIKTERAAFVAARRIRQSDDVEYASIDELFPAPPGWIWVNVVDVAVVQGGKRLPNGAGFSETPTPYIYIRVTDMKNGSIAETGLKYISESVQREISRYTINKEDLYITIAGTIGQVGFVPQSLDGQNLTENAAKIVFRGFERRFFQLALSSDVVQLQLLEKTRQMAQPKLALKRIAGAKLCLPPLAEQKRIVAKVDELMALCDRLEAQQQERDTRHAALARASLARFAEAPTPANLDFLFHNSYTITPADLRKTILTLAVQGKVVPQVPSDQPAEQLLDIIGKQRAKLFDSQSLRRTKPCRQFSSEEAPHEVPDAWVWTMLGEITDIGTGSTPSRTEASFWTDGSIPWITSGSTSNSPITEGDEFVTESAVKAHRLRVYPPGTLLVALYGQGKTRGQVAALEISATINQACAAVCALDGIAPMQGYLKLLLEKQYDEMRLLSAGGAQPNLNVQKIKEVFVPLPPLAEQHRIVAKVDQLMAWVDQLETQLTASRATAEKLMQAVVAELTTQAA